MPESNLYKIGRLINTPEFETRVSAAMVIHAQTLVPGGAAGKQKNLAIYTLLNPMAPESSMVALVAADAQVLAQSTLEGPVVGLGGLADAEITRVVAAKWPIVAEKYPKDPTPVAAA